MRIDILCKPEAGQRGERVLAIVRKALDDFAFFLAKRWRTTEISMYLHFSLDMIGILTREHGLKSITFALQKLENHFFIAALVNL